MEPEIYAQKFSQSWVKNSEKNFLEASPVEGQPLQQKGRKKEKKKGDKQNHI